MKSQNLDSDPESGCRNTAAGSEMPGLPGCLLEETREMGHRRAEILILNGLNLILRVLSPPKAYNVTNPNLSTFIKSLKLGYMCSSMIC